MNEERQEENSMEQPTYMKTIPSIFADNCTVHWSKESMTDHACRELTEDVDVAQMDSLRIAVCISTQTKANG